MVKDMTQGSPVKLMLTFSLPLLIGNVFQQFYNMADAIIVGQFVGEEALAAVGSTGSLVFLILGFALGLASGFGVMISQCFGAKDERRLKHYVAMSLMLSAVISVLITLIAVIFTRTILKIMNTPENIFADAYSYVSVIFAGSFTAMYYNVLASILRGMGDSKTPLYFLILASLLNVVLDLVFIIVFHSGVAGAAYATVISQGISALLCYLYMIKKFPMLRLSKEDWKFRAASARMLLGVGMPMALQFSITAVGVMILQAAINRFGSSVVAAYTAASKVEQLATQPMQTLGTTLAMYCGQNLGAGNYKRIREGVRKGIFMSFGATLIAMVINMGFGRIIVGWFINNPSAEVMGYAMQYLDTVAFFYVALAILFAFRNVLQGMGSSFVPMLCGGAEMVTRTLVAFTLTGAFGYQAVCMASPMAWLAAAVPLTITYLLQIRRPEKYFILKKA